MHWRHNLLLSRPRRASNKRREEPTRERTPADGTVTPLLQIDDGRLLNQLPVWAPEAAIRKKILADNPARLYGF